MKTMLVSEFKAKCIAVLKEVERSGEPVVVTMRGRPMARVERFPTEAPVKRLGALKINYDPVEPLSAEEWPAAAWSPRK